MPKRGGKSHGSTCPQCGAVVQPSKTWQLVSPLPDSQGRITITIMGSFQCPQCGYKWKGVVTKMKVGEDVEIEGVKKPTTESVTKPRQSSVIELDLEDIMSEEG